MRIARSRPARGSDLRAGAGSGRRAASAPRRPLGRGAAAFGLAFQAEDLVSSLDFARENGGTAGLDKGRAVLVAALRARGLEPQEFSFACHAWRADWAAVALVLGAACLAWAALRRDRRPLAGLAAAVVLALASLGGGLDGLQRAALQRSLQVTIEPVSASQREVILGAHYDSKTEPLDHLGRGLLSAATAVLVASSTIAPLLRRGSGRPLGLAAALALLLVALQLAGGRWSADRSHGVVDDGAASVLLVELAAEARTAPLAATRLRFVWWSGEEVGAQGSAAFAGAQPASSLPRLVINLECLGAGPDLGIASHEWTGCKIAAPDPGLARGLEAAAGTPLRRLPFPVVTDAGPWIRRGVPAVTLLGLPPGGGLPRHLHGAGDDLSRLDRRGLDHARRTLQRLLHDLDSNPG